MLNIFLKQTEDALGTAIKSVVLFGSVARGQAKPESDIDLLVLYKGSRKQITERLVEILVEIRSTQEYKDLSEKGIQAEIYPFLISEKGLEDTLWILLDASEHGIILKDSKNLFEGKLKSIQERITVLGGKRILLPNNKWHWTIIKDFECLTKEGVEI